MHLNFDHQRNIFDPRDAQWFTLIGAGSVGSQVMDNMAHMGCAGEVWDGDYVASHNVPMSAYWRSHILRPKVYALAEMIETTTGVKIKTHYEMYTGSPLKANVIACVHDMEARQMIWKQVKKNSLVSLLIDTRIAEEYIEVFAIQTCEPEDIEYYEYFLRYSSTDAFQSTCGNHGIKYVSGTAANIACAALIRWWKGGIPKRHLMILCSNFREV